MTSRGQRTHLGRTLDHDVYLTYTRGRPQALFQFIQRRQGTA